MKLTKQEAADIAAMVAIKREKLAKRERDAEYFNSIGNDIRAMRAVNEMNELDDFLRGIEYVLMVGGYSARECGGEWCVMSNNTWAALEEAKERG